MRFPITVALCAFSTAAWADLPPPPPAPVVVDTPVAEPARAPTGPQKFILDTKKSSFVVQVFKEGAASALAHDHVVAATKMSGSVTVDPADRTTARVEVTVQTSGLVNDEAKLRAKYGLEGEIADKDRATILGNMQDKDQLDVGNFPTITFVSTSVTPGEGNALTLNGKLTIHGVSRDIALPATVAFDKGRIDGTGTIKLKTSDFGIEPYSAFFGAVRNKDGIILHVHFVANAS